MALHATQNRHTLPFRTTRRPEERLNTFIQRIAAKCRELVKRRVHKGKGLGRMHAKTPLIERRYNLSNMRVGNDLYVLQLVKGVDVDANTGSTVSHLGYVIFAERPIVEGST